MQPFDILLYMALDILMELISFLDFQFVCLFTCSSEGPALRSKIVINIINPNFCWE